MRVEEGFQQSTYDEPNPFSSDPVLPTLLRRYFSEGNYSKIKEDLIRFADRVANDIREISASATPPTLTQYNQWGQRVDHLNTSESWRKLKAIMQTEGLVSVFYEREFGDLSRVYGFAKEMIAVGDAQVIFCPLSMTDGAARVIELLGTPGMKRDIFPRLISRDPEAAFTAGQWMTERPGGSDVSQTETIATPAEDIEKSAAPGSTYTLEGFKWFSSATDSNISLVLARTGLPSDGSRGLSLFLVPLRRPLFPTTGSNSPSSTSNGILVHRLKNKIGTQIVPTAELSLNGTHAYLLSPLNAGVKSIAPVLNITRMHCAINSIGYLRRGLSIARAYADVRRVRGQKTLLRDVPIHTSELAKISLVYRALTHFFFGVTHLLGKSECGTASADERRRLRMLTPTLKAFAADKGVAAVEECMAALGGQGYMEETGIGRLIRDGLVEKIWEGTIVVLSLDLVRAATEPDALSAYLKWANFTISNIPSTLLVTIDRGIKLLQASLQELSSAFTTPIAPLVPRPALMLAGHITSALYLLEHTTWSHKHRSVEVEHEVDAEVFVRWVEEGGLDSAVKDVRKMKFAGVGRSKRDEEIVYGAGQSKARL